MTSIITSIMAWRHTVETTELTASLLESHDLHFPTETPGGASPLKFLFSPCWDAAEGFWFSGFNHSSQIEWRALSFHVTQKLSALLHLLSHTAVIMWNHFSQGSFWLFMILVSYFGCIRKCRISRLLMVMFDFLSDGSRWNFIKEKERKKQLNADFELHLDCLINSKLWKSEWRMTNFLLPWDK